MAQFTTTFTCNAHSLTGSPVAGCAVRVVSSDQNDVTTQLSGVPILTGPDGAFRSTLSLTQSALVSLLAGVFTVLANAPGYAPYSETITAVSGTRISTISVNLTPIAAGALPEITYDGAAYVSPLYPVDVIAAGAASTAPWELIEARVESESGAVSPINVPVIGGEARINLQARLILAPRLHLVPDNAPGLVDPDFSGAFTTTFASITSSGNAPLPGEVLVRAANIAPSGDTNDLSDFTNDGGLASWITPWAELPKFQGHYADAMIWLPKAGQGDYLLRTVFQNSSRQLVGQRADGLPAELFAPKKAVRVRIPEPVAGAVFALLSIEQGGVVQTQPLTVRYHG